MVATTIIATELSSQKNIIYLFIYLFIDIVLSRYSEK